MDLLLEGELSTARGMKPLLDEIAKLKEVEIGILRLASPIKGQMGRLAVRKGKHIVGGQISEPETTDGYAAVKTLLCLDEGNYAYLDGEGKLPPELDQALHMSISKIVERWPDLPEQSAELFDEEALLDEVFNHGKPQSLQEEAPREHSLVQTGPASMVESDPNAAWKILKPFLGDNTDTQPTLSLEQPEELEFDRQGRPPALDKLRTADLRPLKSRRYPALIGPIILLLAVLIVVVSIGLISSYNAERPLPRKGAH